MLNAAQLAEFEKNGFLKGDVVLNVAEVERLREELDLVMEGKAVKKPILNHNMREEEADSLYKGMKMSVSEKVVQIVNIWMASDAYLQHAGHSVICEEIAQLCKTDTLRVWHDQIQYKPPVTGGPTPWHQDHPLWRLFSQLTSSVHGLPLTMQSSKTAACGWYPAVIDGAITRNILQVRLTLCLFIASPNCCLKAQSLKLYRSR